MALLDEPSHEVGEIDWDLMMMADHGVPAPARSGRLECRWVRDAEGHMISVWQVPPAGPGG